MMTVQDKIAKIVESEYRNYKGRLMTSLMHQHATLRKDMGDEYFLMYLEKQVIENPRPVYNLDEYLKRTTNGIS